MGQASGVAGAEIETHGRRRFLRHFQSAAPSVSFIPQLPRPSPSRAGRAKTMPLLTQPNPTRAVCPMVPAERLCLMRECHMLSGLDVSSRATCDKRARSPRRGYSWSCTGRVDLMQARDPLKGPIT